MTKKESTSGTDKLITKKTKNNKTHKNEKEKKHVPLFK